MRSTIIAVAAVMLIPVGAVAAQVVHPRGGDRIRITAAPYTLDNRTASVLAVRNDSLFLRVDAADTLAVALAGVTRLDLSTDRRRHTLKGAGIGTLVGVGSGAVLGFASGDDSPGWFALTAGEKAVLGGAVLGVTGLVIGTVVGTLHVSERWTSIPLGQSIATPSLQVGRGRAGLAVTVAF